MPENNDQAGAPKLETTPTSTPTPDSTPADRHEAKEAADRGADTSILPDPDEEGSGLEEIDDSLVRAENS